jgi:hypothetical protein
MQGTSVPRRAKAWLLTVAAALGIAVGAAGIATAASDGSSSTDASSSSAGRALGDTTAAQDPASMPNGPGETLLTGDVADRVTAAALDALPGATIIRVETDSAGSPYEAHVTKADGTQATVKVDESFTVTGVEDGFGARPAR